MQALIHVQVGHRRRRRTLEIDHRGAPFDDLGRDLLSVVGVALVHVHPPIIVGRIAVDVHVVLAGAEAGDVIVAVGVGGVVRRLVAAQVDLGLEWVAVLVGHPADDATHRLQREVHHVGSAGVCVSAGARILEEGGFVRDGINLIAAGWQAGDDVPPVGVGLRGGVGGAGDQDRHVGDDLPGLVAHRAADDGAGRQREIDDGGLLGLDVDHLTGAQQVEVGRRRDRHRVGPAVQAADPVASIAARAVGATDRAFDQHQGLRGRVGGSEDGAGQNPARLELRGGVGRGRVGGGLAVLRDAVGVVQRQVAQGIGAIDAALADGHPIEAELEGVAARAEAGGVLRLGEESPAAVGQEPGQPIGAGDGRLDIHVHVEIIIQAIAVSVGSLIGVAVGEAGAGRLELGVGVGAGGIDILQGQKVLPRRRLDGQVQDVASA